MSKPKRCLTLMLLIISAAWSGGCVGFVTNSIVIGAFDAVRLEIEDTLTQAIEASFDESAGA